jgi:hypothetical protein
MIEAELALITSDLAVRVLPDPGEAFVIEFFCNLKTAEEIEREDAEFARLYGDQPPTDVADYVHRWTVHFRTTENGGGHFDVRSDEGSAEYRVERMADVFQDLVIDSTWVARPRCPQHPHPMNPRSDGSVMQWACPKSGKIRCDIGGYRAFAEQHGLTIEP